MILVDSSAWVEYLRGTQSPVCQEVRLLLITADIAITDPIVMEILAGARDEPHARQLRLLLGRTAMTHCTHRDYDAAALLYRLCRERGETVRRLIDCLIAAVALREGLPILHRDRDYEVLARHTPLKIHRP